MCMAAIAAMSLLACHGTHDDHDHDHDADEHETTKADAHDEHGTDDIHFTDAQAKACNLKVETLQPSTFAEVVHVSGRVLPAQGAEATVTATMPGHSKLYRKEPDRGRGCKRRKNTVCD